MALSQTPYLDLAQAYEQKARANLAEQEAALQKQLVASKQATSANYDSAASGNYINYMKQQNALGEQLAAQGIRGGASESALARIGNNYALNQGNTTASRYAALGAIQNTHDTNVTNLRQAMAQRIMDTNLALQQSQIQYEDTLAQRAAEEARYREEVERAMRERQEDIERNEKYRNEDIAREEARYTSGIEREDKLRAEENAREDMLRELTWGREDTQRAEDIARDDARYKAEQKRYAKEYKTEQSWKKKEWGRYAQEKKVEEYAAGLTRYVGTNGVKKLQKLRNNITKQKGWAKDKVKYGKVQAINARIGAIRNGKQ